GCEYMTGGTAVILGAVGDNFGAGMTGGMAFIYDIDGNFERRVNPESLVWQRLASAHWEEMLKKHIVDHLQRTGSPRAAELLDDWADYRGYFWQLCPKEMVNRIEHPLSDDAKSA
ncbi:MAG TPA: hypothetical protein DHV49_02915, partial [Alphaproteobacteria bacterium]|nr:hypothetical protein [Alphaproteobacteria bacterium]